MEQDAHQGLSRPMPLDSAVDDVQALMKRQEPAEWKALEDQSRL